MARKKHLINVHTSTGTTAPVNANLRLGEIAVQHTDNEAALWIKMGSGETSTEYEKFIGETEIINLLEESKILGSGYTYSGLPYVNSSTTIADAYSALTNEVLENELVTAAGLIDLSDKIDELSAATQDIHVDMILGSGYTYSGLPYINSSTTIADAYSALTNEMLKDEKTVSAVINDINRRIDENTGVTIVSGDVISISAATVSISGDVAGVNVRIDDLEEVTAHALNDLDGRVNALEAESGATDNIKKTTWSALKSLRDASGLTPGMQYKITDYNCTTTQDGTQSAGHQFDIIVTADDVNKLNENARACLHSGDTYFSGANAKLEGWKIWYCIDNDSNRFFWADTTNGKGVIYRMIDEWGNDCPYDFKNIQFARYKITACQKVPDLVGSYSINGINDITVDTSVTYYSYTFCMIDTNDDSSHDVSVEQDVYYNDDEYKNKTYNNIFKNYFYVDYGDSPIKELMALPDNCMVTDTDLCAIEENYGEFYGFHSNTFGNGCYSNTFGNGCGGNTFGIICYSNTLGSGCYSNTFGNDCGGNTFGINCYSNTFGINCYNNTFGNRCGGNTFGNDCGGNTFGNDYYSNTFGINCYNNTFGNNCGGNTFGNDCNHIRFNKDYMNYIIVESGNQYITITSTQTTSSLNILRNLTISQGINNTSAIKTISHNTTNDAFKTTYQAANSQIVNI